MKGQSTWQELAKVEKRRTALRSKSLVVSIFENETHELALSVALVDSPPILSWLRRRQKSRGKTADAELLKKLEALTDPTLIDRMMRSE